VDVRDDRKQPNQRALNVPESVVLHDRKTLPRKKLRL
jgi:hypothetical protein